MAPSRDRAYDDYGDWDEDTVRVRPPRHGSRPRSKLRPTHEEAISGRVIGVDRGRYTLLVDEDGADEREVVAARARELGRRSIVVGDRVDAVGDLSGAEGTLARVVRIRPRTTLLRRSADDADQVERLIVANADRIAIVVAAADPAPRPGLVERSLAVAYDARVEPLLVITKADLGPTAPLRELVAPLQVPVFESGRDASGNVVVPEDLAEALAGRFTVLVGHSGVGKSTLVNLLSPGAERATGSVNAVTGRGRHTSSSSVALPVGAASGGAARGWIVDTPGVRSFGLGHVDADALQRRLLARAAAEPAAADRIRSLLALLDAG